MPDNNLTVLVDILDQVYLAPRPGSRRENAELLQDVHFNLGVLPFCYTCCISWCQGACKRLIDVTQS